MPEVSQYNEALEVVLLKEKCETKRRRKQRGTIRQKLAKWTRMYTGLDKRLEDDDDGSGDAVIETLQCSSLNSTPLP